MYKIYTFLFFSFLISQEATYSIGMVDEASDAVQIMIDSTGPIYGFQFQLSGATAVSAGGGMAQSAGFITNVGGGTVIGFTLMGIPIPAGSGVLINVQYANPIDPLELCVTNAVLSGVNGAPYNILYGDCYTAPVVILGCTDPSATNYNPDATMDDGSCEYPQFVELSIDVDNPESNIISIYVNNPGPMGIYGFQFDLYGTEIISAYGGFAEQFGLSVIPGGDTVLGFSMIWDYIPIGEGVLTYLGIELIPDLINELCISNAVISGINSINLEVSYGDCIPVGCTAPSAENYNPNALIDDGTCIYVPDLFMADPSLNQAFYFFQEITLDYESLVEGDWIGAFKGDVCVGAAPWNGEWTEVPVFGDDGGPGTEGYMQTGDIPEFMVYDASENLYFDATASAEVPWANFGVEFIELLYAFTAPPDCAGVLGGDAFIDDCGICTGGSTGLVPNYLNYGCGCYQPPPSVYCQDYDGDGLGSPFTVSEFCQFEVPDDYVPDCTDPHPWGDIRIEYGDIDPAAGIMILEYSSNVPVYGFDITIEGFEINAFSSSAFNTFIDGSSIIGFSIQGNNLPAGEGEFGVLHFEPFLGGEVCINDGVITGQNYHILGFDTGVCIYVESAPVDCMDVINGLAYLDDCMICSGGTSGHLENSDLDLCGICPDELNAPPGYHYDDGPDCNNDCFGEAFIDDCGFCSEGNSGHVTNSDMDACGVCPNNSNAPPGYTFNDGPDCNGDCFGLAFIDDCGICSEGNSNHFENSDDLGCGCFAPSPEIYYIDEDEDGLGFGPGESFCPDISGLITPNSMYDLAPVGWVLNNDDVCPNDPLNDSDQDGVCGDVDICDGGDDNIDYDTDGIPDFCDQTPWGDIIIEFGAIDEISSNLQISYVTNVPVYALQFVVNGIDILSADGEWLNFFSVNNLVSGFDLFGGSIPAGQGTLVNLNYAYTLEVEACIENLIFVGLNNHQLGITVNEQCVTVPSTPIDCWGTFFGAAFEDQCGICSAGLSGHTPNSDIDNCNVCPDGSYGYFSDDLAPDSYDYGDGPDCSNICFGGAIIDTCGECTEGNTGLSENFALDDCGVCYGENQNMDCNGECFGFAIENECGCVGGNTGLVINWCAGCMDESAVNYNPEAYLDDGSCAYPGDWNGDGVTNVIDIVGMIDIILLISEPTDYHMLVCDIDGDGYINVVDVVLIIDYIYAGSLSSYTPLSKSEIEVKATEVQIYSNGSIAGLQMEISGDYEIVSVNGSPGWNYFKNNDMIVLLSMDGSLLESNTLFEYAGELTIEHVTVTGWNGLAVIPEVRITPELFSFSPAYPNPFNPVTSFQYTIPERAEVRINVFDLHGRFIESLVSEMKQPGSYTLSWTADGYPSGVYLVSLNAGSYKNTQKVILLK